MGFVMCKMSEKKIEIHQETKPEFQSEVNPNLWVGGNLPEIESF